MQSGRIGASAATVRRYRLLFLVAALYDGLLGLAFLVAPGPIFAWLAVPVPENPTYVHLAAGFIAVQGLGYFFVWRRLWRNVDIVIMGIVYKLVYVATAVASLARGDLPHDVFAWFAAADVLFLIGFALFLRTAREVRHQERSASRAGQALGPAHYWTREG